MNKTEIKGDVGQLFQAETINYSVTIEQVCEQPKRNSNNEMSAIQRERIAKLFLCSLFVISMSIIIKLFSDDSLGLIGDLIVIAAMFICIAASEAIFKKS